MNGTLKKRIEEAAINGSKHYDSDVSKCSQGKQVGYIRGFNEGAKYALQHQWISVEESLPEYDKLVIAKHKPIADVHSYQDNISLAYFQKQGAYGIRWIINGMSWAINKSNKEDNTVLAWMPIPELKLNCNG